MILNTLLFSDDEDLGELIRLIPQEEEEDQMNNLNIPPHIPILPLKNTVLFPGVIIPITVSRQKSIKLIKKAYKNDRIIGVVAQNNIKIKDPSYEDLNKVGTVAKILKMLISPDGNATTMFIQGKRRFKLLEVIKEAPYLLATHELLDDQYPPKNDNQAKKMMQSLKDIAFEILKFNPEVPQEAQAAVDNIKELGFLTYFLSSNLNAEVGDKQKLLETNNILERSNLLLNLMVREINMLELRNEIQTKVNSDISQQQRDYYLRQQIKVLQDELGNETPVQDVKWLKEKGNKKEWPESVARFFFKEVEKLERTSPVSAEYSVSFNHLELLTDLPWGKVSKDNFDLKNAKKVLDQDHFGLEKVKNRIIEYLAVLKLRQDMKAPILCLYGPPGVGKTSLGKSIARALGRKYVRMALGGLQDEAEIRGHRKTYIGAMPGKVIQNIKKAKTSNPVFVLDEIDKVSSDFRGDPSSALLEVLDPEQNNSFSDNYLETEYDLSKVLFVATANTLDTIQVALRDRMEMIEINGYTVEEKMEIARRYLIPKQRKEHGLKASDIMFNKKVISKVIEGYTRESGVRNLERQLGTVIRNVAKSIAMEEEYDKRITPDHVIKVLGAEIFDKEEYQDNKIAGVSTGLAWTSVGGDILYIESSLSRGKGTLTLSGQLGPVMKESAVAALSYLKSYASELGINYKIFNQFDLHIHVPAGAVPKDGPSAGITMLTSLASVFTQRKVRAKLGMTGEITLRGKVLPVGGIKEKVLAAKRAGICDLILCHKNKKDIDEIDQDHIKDMTFHFVDTADEVLSIALLEEMVDKPINLEVKESDLT